MSQSDDIEELIGKIWGGRYQLLEFIGRGGMGMVFKARHLQMDRVVALKVIHRKLCQDEKQVQRFEQEARTSSKLHHPNSIRVYDYGTSDDARLFMAMEFLSGVTLGKLIQNEGPLPPERVIHIARQIIKSLSEAHELGLVHRDLKPENIVICDIYGERDFVKVLDFGIAKAIGQSEEQMNLTQTGFICGTPRYLSPEQALGHDVDGRADLYSVGVLMYEMLTGRPPFIGENPISIVMKHVHDDPPPLTGMEKYGDEGRKITWLVERLLEKNPERRPSPGERIVEFVDGRIDESELVGRPVSVQFSRTDTRSSAADHPSRGAVRDFVGDAGETMPSVSPEAKTLPPLASLDVKDLSDKTAVLEAASVPPGPPPVPTSDETAMIQRPEVIATRESASPVATAQDEEDDEAGETRIISLQELMPETVNQVDPEGPRIRRASDTQAREEHKGRAPQTRPQQRTTPPGGRSRPRDPLWAWVTAGLAVAILILSGVVYVTAPGRDKDTSPVVAEVVAQAPSAQESSGTASVAMGTPPVELVASPSSPAGDEALAVPSPRTADGIAGAAPGAAPGVPETSGQLVGKLLAKIQIPAPAPEPAPEKVAKPTPVPTQEPAPAAKLPPAVSSSALAEQPEQAPDTAARQEAPAPRRDWSKKVLSAMNQRAHDASEKAKVARREVAEAAKAQAAETEKAQAAEREKARAAKRETARAQERRRKQARRSEARSKRAVESKPQPQAQPQPQPQPESKPQPQPESKPKAKPKPKPEPKPEPKPKRKARPDPSPSFDPF